MLYTISKVILFGLKYCSSRIPNIHIKKNEHTTIENVLTLRTTILNNTIKKYKTNYFSPTTHYRTSFVVIACNYVGIYLMSF